MVREMEKSYQEIKDVLTNSVESKVLPFIINIFTLIRDS